MANDIAVFVRNIGNDRENMAEQLVWGERSSQNGSMDVVVDYV